MSIKLILLEEINKMEYPTKMSNALTAVQKLCD